MVDRSDGVAVKAAAWCVVRLIILGVRLGASDDGEVETMSGRLSRNKQTNKTAERGDMNCQWF